VYLIASPDPPHHLTAMRLLLMACAALHAIFTIVLLAMPDIQLTLTVRHQFNDWGPLLDLLRAPPPADATIESIRAQAQNLSWCAAPLPQGTTRAPYCKCVDQNIDTIANDSLWKDSANTDVRDRAVMGFVACLSTRPVWRVAPFWGIHYGIPAIFALLVSSCFLWVAAGLKRRWTNIPIWILCLSVSVALIAQDPMRNSLCVITILLVGVLIEWVLLPGMIIPPELVSTELLAPSTNPADRATSSFWWCEYLCAPVFALYVPLMHCGRDFVMTGTVVVLGGAVGGLGLRSFWCAKAYAEDSKDQFRDVMQRIVWLGILASSTALICIAAVYYQHDQPTFSMGKGSIVLLCTTIAIGLLQWPGISVEFPRVLHGQAALALARNVVLFALIAVDLW
jgi:hypothetical protein